MEFRNKIDIFHYILYGFVSLLVISSVFLIFGNDTKFITKIFMVIIFLLIELYFTGVMFFSSYYFSNDKLICKIANVELSYLYDNIKSVSESYGLSLFVNTSFKCIKIKTYDGKSIKISPKNKDEFLKEMGKHGFLLRVKKKVSDEK